LHVKKESEAFLFDLQFQPEEYLQLIRPENNPGNKGNMQYYLLNISVLENSAVSIVDYNVRSQEEIQKRNYYFSYLFQNDIELEESGKRHPCILYHFERPADSKNNRTFVLGFDNTLKSEEVRLIINSPYFGSLPVKIEISKENIPSLKV
jgi:hypothetical protein